MGWEKMSHAGGKDTSQTLFDMFRGLNFIPKAVNGTEKVTSEEEGFHIWELGSAVRHLCKGSLKGFHLESHTVWSGAMG